MNRDATSDLRLRSREALVRTADGFGDDEGRARMLTRPQLLAIFTR
jgi:hypothetical protein